MEPKNSRSLSLPLHVAAFIVAVIIFVIGIWIGNSLAGQVNQEFYNEVDKLQSNAVTIEFLSILEKDLSTADADLRASTCSAVKESAAGLSEQTEDVGRRLRILEDRRGQEIVSLAQRYFSLEARDYLFWKKFKTICTDNLTLVIYFYKTDCLQCKAFEVAISNFKQQNPRDVLVYSFNLERAAVTPSITMFASLYNVSTAPSIVVNDKKLSKQPSAEELAKLARS